MQKKIEIVKERTIYCDGGSHPRVYLEIGGSNEVICPYCNKKFVYKEN